MELIVLIRPVMSGFQVNATNSHQHSQIYIYIYMTHVFPVGLAVSTQEEKQQTQQDAATGHEKPAEVGEPVYHTC